MRKDVEVVCYFWGMLSKDLTGKTALIGGSTQGIGLASAQAMADMGARCVLVSRNEDKLKADIGIYVVLFEVFDTSGKVERLRKTCVLAHRLN